MEVCPPHEPAGPVAGDGGPAVDLACRPDTRTRPAAGRLDTEASGGAKMGLCFVDATLC